MGFRPVKRPCWHSKAVQPTPDAFDEYCGCDSGMAWFMERCYTSQWPVVSRKTTALPIKCGAFQNQATCCVGSRQNCQILAAQASGCIRQR